MVGEVSVQMLKNTLMGSSPSFFPILMDIARHDTLDMNRHRLGGPLTKFFYENETHQNHPVRLASTGCVDHKVASLSVSRPRMTIEQ